MPEHLHFLGIGGHAMRGVAHAAVLKGHIVTGTDEGAYPPGSDWLDAHGITWWRQPDSAHVDGVDRVIISGHIQPDHPELVAAQAAGIKIESFPEFVAGQLTDVRRIVVAGTHGKTTTTSLVTWLLESAGRKPDFLIGIKPHNFDSSVRLEASPVAVLEGDEYRASQLDTKSKFDYYHPDVLVVTSIEMDHPDFFQDLADIQGRFTALINGLPADGKLYYSQNVPREVITQSQQQGEWYGDDRTDSVPGGWQAGSIEFTSEGLTFALHYDYHELGLLKVPLYGRHNVLNSLAAAAVALGEGVTVPELQQGLETFLGASRRFERISVPGSPITVIDDYAHHPTEVATTLEAAKLHFKGRVLAIFRPHTYSRTKELLGEYHKAFNHADMAYIAPIETAREGHLEGTVSHHDLANGAGEQVVALDDRDTLVETVVSKAKPGDLVLCMSVNGYDDLAHELARKLAAS